MDGDDCSRVLLSDVIRCPTRVLSHERRAQPNPTQNRQLMSLFAESKAREVRSFVQLAQQRVDAAHLAGQDPAAVSDGSGTPSVGAASSASYRNGGSGVNRCASISCYDRGYPPFCDEGSSLWG